MTSAVFFGDSITAGSRTLTKPLGEGFVSMVADKMAGNPLFLGFDPINAGVNGHTVHDLLRRVQADVIHYFPHLLIIKIGINDAYNDQCTGEECPGLKRYKTDYTHLIRHIQQELPACQMLLLSPYFISDTQQEVVYKRMALYGEVVQNLGKDFDLPVLDTQDIFNKAVKQKAAREWAADQIHPSKEGHALLADVVYQFILKHFKQSPVQT